MFQCVLVPASFASARQRRSNGFARESFSAADQHLVLFRSMS
jgi:hypothetical protein